MLYFCIAPSYEAAKGEAIRYLSTEYNQSFDQLVDKYCILGTVSECVATLERYIEAGVEHLNLIPMCPQPAVIDQLGQISEAVFPRYRTPTSGS